MNMVEISLDAVMIIIGLISAVSDLRKHVIYDWITFPALAIGLITRFAAYGLGGMFDQGLAAALFGAGFCFLIFGLFLIWGKGMGGGDVKLIAALGALAGFHHCLSVVMCTALVGGVFALGLLVARRKLLGTDKGLFHHMFTTRIDGTDRVTLPYGLPIAVGVIWATLSKYGLLGGF